MATVKMMVGGLIGIINRDVELDIPDAVIAKGDEAMLKWANKNITYLDQQTFKARSYETTVLREVTEMKLEK
ncbi:hypothetical protein AB0C33_01955 [Nonomuraea sp. NPDC048881]|uniref:hypothetical protein n=1 Tax=Nonomuraea sp. NPDC048881 TaxID=3155030 RepID=UPI0033E5CBD3